LEKYRGIKEFNRKGLEVFGANNLGGKGGGSFVAALCLLECAAAGSQTSVGSNGAWPTGWGWMASWCWYLWGGDAVQPF
jgi:hypothetical protein